MVIMDVIILKIIKSLDTKLFVKSIGHDMSFYLMRLCCKPIKRILHENIKLRPPQGVCEAHLNQDHKSCAI